jgi:hypothetical protein
MRNKGFGPTFYYNYAILYFYEPGLGISFWGHAWNVSDNCWRHEINITSSIVWGLGRWLATSFDRGSLDKRWMANVGN